MRSISIPSFILILGVSLVPADMEAAAESRVVKVGSQAPADASVRDIDVCAKKYKFIPTTIEVPVNTLVRIHLTAVDRRHGFEIKSFEGSCVKYKPGEPVTVEFYADKVGEYEFKCCNYCGLGHRKMKGKLVVN